MKLFIDPAFSRRRVDFFQLQDPEPSREAPGSLFGKANKNQIGRKSP